ncbi:hypothetical protein BASA81_017818 [Batrachochytrium salamandrivorans]|nr:hypothetical protein BASA81_017818 [Batrachochytrium salamandrivorans]
MEDGDGLDICERGDGARGMGVRGTEVKTLTPGTLRIGPFSHVGTFFVDCGADDIFMDSKLAEELKVPLTKLSNPITLRLADGDSSSTLTHRTVPLQLHIGNHVETVSFYVTSLCPRTVAGILLVGAT